MTCFQSVADDTTGMGLGRFHIDRHTAVHDGVAFACGSVAVAHESCRVHVTFDGARHVQVLDGVVLGILEGSFKGAGRIVYIHSQRMAIAVENTAEGTAAVAATVTRCDVGIEADIHVFLTLGSLNHVTEGVPVFSGLDGEVVIVRRRKDEVEGRLALLYIHIYIVRHARAREIQNLVALCALVLVERIGLVIDKIAGTVARHNAQHHLGTVVPYGTVLVGIVPRHADGVGPLVLPLSRIVGNAQQVQVIDNALRARASVLGPVPVFGDGAAHTVGQLV